MDAQILTLERELAYYKAKAQECTDIIKLLTGYTPDHCAITFSVKKNPIVTFEVGEPELNFSIGFFMSWHSFYTKRIQEHQTVLLAMRAVPTDSCGR
jgi:hypothetical protein